MGGSSKKKRGSEALQSPRNKCPSDTVVSSPSEQHSNASESSTVLQLSDTSEVAIAETSCTSAPSSPVLRSDISDLDSASAYVSPLRRVRQAVEREANRRVIDTVDELKEFIRLHDPQGKGVPASVAATIVVAMRVVWTSFEVWNTGPVARLHLIDRCVDEPVEEMHQVMRDDYNNKKSIVDTELVTASLYGVEKGAHGLPTDGELVRVNRLWSLKLFARHACQLSTSIESLRVGV